MASPSSFNPLSLVSSGIGGAFQYAAAKKQADAATHAADLQAKSAQEALDYTKGVKAAQTTAFAPYQAVGAQATAALPGAVRPMPQGPPAPYGSQPRAVMPQAQPLSQLGQPPAPTANPSAPSGPMVLLQAPDGSQKQVPQAQAAMYIARGAKQVG